MTRSIAIVFLYGLITALSTGLGALPFAFLKNITARTVSWANALAAGLMLGASFGLLIEGSHHGPAQTIAGAGFGVVFIILGQRLFGHSGLEIAGTQGQAAQRILLVIAAMTIHSFAEGVAIGVAFGGGQKLAVLITVAIAVHNIPEGLAITAVMRPRGSSLAACAGWSILTSLPQPLMAVPAFLFVDAFQAVLPYGLGFAAGAMVFLVFLELLPEAYENAAKTSVGLLVSLSLALMILFQRYL